MRTTVGPIVRRELQNLDKDVDCRKSAMKALKHYVKEMDSKAIPLFLAQVSETKVAGSTGEYTISLYEVLARVHGPKIVPQIENIMNTVVNTLTSSASSFALQQACSKVVPAIARYGIDPTTPEDKKRHIIYSLAKPLSDSLLVNQESLSSGSALCLKALVDSDNWRFASNEMVNEVCQRVAGALDKPMQANSHIGLVMALARSNSLVVEAYARLFIQAGLRILTAGIAEGNSQKRLSAIQMVNFLIKSLDPKSIFSELELIMEEMEKCQSDKMAYVKGAAYEALQTAKKITAEEEKKIEREIGSNSGSNFCRSPSPRRIFWNIGDQSSLSTSPESQTIDECDSFMASPFSSNYASGNFLIDRKSANRKHWRRFANGGLDVSLKDGIFSEVTPRSVIDHSEHDKSSGNKDYYENGFAGFFQRSPRNTGIRSATPSPQRSRSRINSSDDNKFKTPRKLICSLQDNKSENSEVSEEQGGRCRSPWISKFESNLASKCSQKGFSRHPASNYDHIFLPKMNHLADKSEDGKEINGSSESVSSSEPITADEKTKNLVSTNKTDSLNIYAPKEEYASSVLKMVCGLFVLVFAVFVCLLWIGGDQDEGCNLLPT
ncbi:Survival motor neuron interacting protein 1 [Heracleum sosnowskyi]|uniref:Survival motor neuron interacting protein 1 n=1 Tax=Heracleum sosnowskyi TaxID=360622 RepID=A0AAD8IIN1_9APIA|nr:Survival motor neuron interacting protein 1 [Heracleum sosnowskyi]